MDHCHKSNFDHSKYFDLPRFYFLILDIYSMMVILVLVCKVSLSYIWLQFELAEGWFATASHNQVVKCFPLLLKNCYVFYKLMFRILEGGKTRDEHIASSSCSLVCRNHMGIFSYLVHIVIITFFFYLYLDSFSVHNTRNAIFPCFHSFWFPMRVNFSWFLGFTGSFSSLSLDSFNCFIT